LYLDPRPVPPFTPPQRFQQVLKKMHQLAPT
jgi:hypothetical protein